MILVTGGCGFIGSHLCEYFLKMGHAVKAIDNLSTGSMSNVKHLIGNKMFSVNRENVCSLGFMPTSRYRDIQVDCILYFASPASPVDYLAAPIQTMEASSIGVQSMLELAVEKNARFVLASTSEIYGDPLVHPQPETYYGNVDTLSPRSVYDESKRFAESLTMAYHRTHGLDTRIVRIFNTYGPRMRPSDGRIVTNFAAQALRGHDLTVYGSGMQTRSLCYIDDLVRGIARIVEYVGPDSHMPFNLGNPREMTVLSIAAMIRDTVNSKSKIIHCQLPIGDPKLRCPDISRAEKILGWVPVIPFEEGLAKFLVKFSKEVLS